jgi:hypothetical protein
MSPPPANRHSDALPRRCARCGAVFAAPSAGGRPPLACPTCRPIHEAELAARRQRRYRQRRQEHAEQVAHSRQRQAAYQARRLLTEHPAAVEVLLTRVSPEVADLVIDELLRQRAAGDQRGG